MAFRTSIRTRYSRVRRALTLLELIIVLVVLTAVAGIVLPTLPSMLTRSHIVVSTTNINELSKAVQVFEQINLRQPSGWDTLTDENGDLFPLLPSDGAIVGGQLTPLDLSTEPEIAAALEDAGITELWTLDSTTESPTYDPYGAAVATSTATVAEITDAAVKDAMLFAVPAERFILFGLGPRCDLVGDQIMEPPSHFGDAPGENAANFYGRFAAVYQVVNADGEYMGGAKFRGFMAVHGDGLDNVNSHIDEFWSLQGTAEE